MSKDADKQIADALLSDPTIFMFDEIYDDIKSKPKQKQVIAIGRQSGSKYQIKKQPLKPKYIDAMKRSTFRRQRQHELVSQRLNLKKAKMGDQQENVFITGSYQTQQQQRRKIQEQMRKQQEYDKQHTVDNKDRNMIAFSRYILKGQSNKQSQLINSLKQKQAIIQKEKQVKKNPEVIEKTSTQLIQVKQSVNNQRHAPQYISTKQLQSPQNQQSNLSPLDLLLTPIFQSTKQAQPIKTVKFYSEKNHQTKLSNVQK